jgi:hypothetical protein
MPQVGFKPTIPVLEWAKTFHALDDAATVMLGNLCVELRLNFSSTVIKTIISVDVVVGWSWDDLK